MVSSPRFFRAIGCRGCFSHTFFFISMATVAPRLLTWEQPELHRTSTFRRQQLISVCNYF